MGAKWLVGVGVNLIGSILINLGTNVMKLGHNKRAALPLAESDKPPISRFREWQFGVAAFTVGNAANFLSFGYAAQSLLSAIGCVQFVSNVIFASFVLKEKVTSAVLLATACIVAGCVLLVSFGDHSSQVFTAKDLLHLYAEPVYVTYLSLSAAAVVGCFLLYHVGRRRVVAAGPGGARGWEAALPVLYSTFSALIGTQSVLFSKTLAVLLRATFSGDNQLKSWFIYLVVPCFLFTAVFWVTRLNKGLTMFPAMVIVPTLQIAWTLFSIVSGMLYFREYRDFSPLSSAMFCVGLLVMFSGVFLLTRAASARPAAGKAGVDAAAGAGAGASKLAPFQRDSFEFDLSGGDDGDRIGAGRHADEDACCGSPAGTRAAAALAPARGGASSPERAEGEEPLTPPPVREAPGGGRREGEGAGLLEKGAEDSSGDAAGGGKPRQLRRVVSSLKRNVQADFNLDAAPAARLALGLGDRSMPAMSVFGPPIIDFGGGGRAAAPQQQPARRRGSDAAEAGARSAAKPEKQAGFGSWDAADGGGGGAVAPAARSGSAGLTRRASGVQMAAAAAAANGGGDEAAGPLPACHLMKGPVSSSINPLSNAISLKPAAGRPPSPFAGFVANMGEAARSIRSAVSSELRATAGQLKHDRGYSHAEALAARGEEEGERLIGGEDEDEAGGGGGYGGYSGGGRGEDGAAAGQRRRPAEL